MPLSVPPPPRDRTSLAPVVNSPSMDPTMGWPLNVTTGRFDRSSWSLRHAFVLALVSSHVSCASVRHTSARQVANVRIRPGSTSHVHPTESRLTMSVLQYSQRS